LRAALAGQARRNGVYHCSVKTISRSTGRSATAAAAYRTASEIRCERTGDTHDYSRKAGVEHTEIIVPNDAPKWAHDRSALWNATEQAETRKNSTVAREWEVALPHQLDRDQRRAATVEYGRWLSERYGIAVEVALHEPGKEGDHRNHHAHILGSTRKLGPDGFGAKTRELDDKKTGSAEVVACREEWATICNHALERAHVQERVDHRSLADQRAEAQRRAADPQRPEPEREEAERRAQELDREPTVHLGPTATAMERDGVQTDRGDQNRAVRARNAERRGLWHQVREWGHQVRDQAAALTGGLARLRAAGKVLAHEKAQADRLRAAGEAMKREKAQQQAQKEIERKTSKVKSTRRAGRGIEL